MKHCYNLDVAKFPSKVCGRKISVGRAQQSVIHVLPKVLAVMTFSSCRDGMSGSLGGWELHHCPFRPPIF